MANNKEVIIKPDLPKGYLKGGYKVTRVPLVTTQATQIAKGLKVKDSGKKPFSNTKSGIRNFYNEVVDSYEKYADNLISEEDLFVRIKTLVPHAEYAHSKKTVTDFFVDFITANVKACENVEDIKYFKEHFMTIYELFCAL